MALLFLIPILVCGYFYLINSHMHKFKIKKVEGQQLYFKCAFHGFTFTILGFGLTSVLISQEFHILNTTVGLMKIQTLLVDNIFYSINLKKTSEIGQSVILQESKRNIGFYSFFLISFLISLLLVMLWNNFCRGYFVIKDCLDVISRSLPFQYLRAFISSCVMLFRKLYLYLRHLRSSDKKPRSNIKISMIQELKDIWWKWKYGINGIKKEIKNPLDSLLYQSIENHQSFKEDFSNTQLIMITMSDRKVYIGLVVGFGKDNDAFSVDNETFFFLPIKSGYRNKYDLRVCVTTDYSSAINNANELDDIQIILNKKSIVSACKFDDSRFKSFDKSPQFFKAN
ncbi:hypothetical protein [Acinetobacter sp.]|uniref:hypothetical protein n=1 Tax=Acinetobacter sp. TaxID=472 RepID=UPI002FC8442C